MSDMTQLTDTDNFTWYTKEGETKDESLHDKGKGEEVLIRMIEFKLNPGLAETPTKEQILTPEYIKQIDVQLWSDGLRRVSEPRMNIDKEYCRIGVPCVPRTGQSFLDKPKLLQEWIQ